MIRKKSGRTKLRNTNPLPMPFPVDINTDDKKSIKKKALFYLVVLLVIVVSFMLGYKAGDYAISSGMLQKLQSKTGMLSQIFQKKQLQSNFTKTTTKTDQKSKTQASLTIGNVTLTTPKTPEEEKQFGEQVDKLSVETSTITIKDGCVIDPIIPKVQFGKSVEIFNNTNTKETLTIGETGTTLELKPKEKIQAPVKFNGQGIYSMLCGSEGLSGLLKIVN
ncbi:hypothetical protein HY947_04725 [Candidatus Gottesmanbacteria bacterium]|nr:hypothetical protein [Candidatus Gottesmanbacteria bacterium]